MASPARPPPPPPEVEPVAPASLPSEHPAADPSCDAPLSPQNPAPAPAPAPAPPTPTPAATPPPHSPPGDSSPSSTPRPSSPQPPPPPSADASPPLPRHGRTSPPRSPPTPLPAPVSPPTPAPASSEAKSEQETAESATPAPASSEANLEQETAESATPAPASSEAKSEREAAESGSESGSMTLAQTEDSTPPTPPKASSAKASPTGSPQKESTVTIAKLLSGEGPAAMEAKPAAEKVAPSSDTGLLAAAATVTAVGGGGGSVGSKRWLLGGGVPEKVRRAELRRAELGFRVSAAVFCLVALSVMAADTTTGWSGDSFRRYNEYRYVLAASVVAFTYSGFQLVAEVHYLVAGRHMIRAPLRSYFNLAMDQMLAYLLLSASSSALSRNGVWMSRFGGDQFTKLISASASMAFLAFIALGLNSIISAYCVFSLVS